MKAFKCCWWFHKMKSWISIRGCWGSTKSSVTSWQPRAWRLWQTISIHRWRPELGHKTTVARALGLWVNGKKINRFKTWPITARTWSPSYWRHNLAGKRDCRTSQNSYSRREQVRRRMISLIHILGSWVTIERCSRGSMTIDRSRWSPSLICRRK